MIFFRVWCPCWKALWAQKLVSSSCLPSCLAGVGHVGIVTSLSGVETLRYKCNLSGFLFLSSLDFHQLCCLHSDPKMNSTRMKCETNTLHYLSIIVTLINQHTLNLFREIIVIYFTPKINKYFVKVLGTKCIGIAYIKNE